MDLEFTPEELAFRQQARDFIMQNYPAETQMRVFVMASLARTPISDAYQTDLFEIVS